MNFEKEYQRRVEEINEGLAQQEMKKRIDSFLSDLVKEFKCDFRLSYEVFPEADDYGSKIDDEEILIPRDLPTMTLKDFIDHINKEDLQLPIYIDPIYMKEGVNEVNDVLTTVVADGKMVIIPVSHNKRIKL
jgi:hypothetical protein